MRISLDPEHCPLACQIEPLPYREESDRRKGKGRRCWLLDATDLAPG